MFRGAGVVLILCVPSLGRFGGMTLSGHPKWNERGFRHALLSFLRMICLVFIAGVAFVSFTGCVTETTGRGGSSRSGAGSFDTQGDFWETAVTGSRGRVDSSGVRSEALSYQSKTSYTNAVVAPLGAVPWNEHSIPLVHPGSEYIAVQSGDPVSWDIRLASAEAGVLGNTAITVYRVEKSADSGRPFLSKQYRLVDVGLLGREANESGFLIESPQDDGARWIGFVDWESGQLSWLVRGSDVNAFGSLSDDGRLAWSWRSVEEARFGLIVQGDNEVYRLPADGGDWLMPVWSGNGKVLFSFRLSEDDTLGVFALDPQTEVRLREPMASRELVENGIVGDAFDTLASIANPAAPDGSGRLLFYHPGGAFHRLCLFDVRKEGITYYKSHSGGGGWYDDESLLLATSRRVYFQEVESGAAPIEMVAGAYLPISSGDPEQVSVLFTPDMTKEKSAVLYLMQLIGSDAVVRRGDVGVSK